MPWLESTDFFVYVLNPGVDVASSLAQGVAVGTMSRFYGVSSATAS